MSLNVLVVDDSAVMRTMIVRCLKMAGIPLGEVHQAANGAEGLELLDKSWIDLLLVDINMPVMTGDEMIRILRERPEARDLPIIVISTEGSRPRIERLEREGIKFIHKPFTAETIQEILKAIPGMLNQ